MHRPARILVRSAAVVGVLSAALLIGGCPPAPDNGNDNTGNGNGNTNGNSNGNGNTNGNDNGTTQAVAPQVADIADQLATTGVAYVGPTPALLRGTTPVDWTLELGPAGMDIDVDTGVVSWDAPVEGAHAIAISATNRRGVDVESFTLNVVSPQDNARFRASSPTRGDGDGASTSASLSADGLLVAFASEAENLVRGDNNGNTDIFLYNRATETTVRINVGPDGDDTNVPSRRPAISADGRFVAFVSFANNLVDEDTNGQPDIFVYEVASGEITLVSVSSGGAQANGPSDHPAMSADGRYVVFDSLASNLVSGDSNDVRDVFLHDRQSGQTRRMSVASSGEQGDGESLDPAIDATGKFIAFTSAATNLVGGDTNDANDVYLRNVSSGVTVRVSVSADGAQADGASGHASIGGAGARYVAFESAASNLVTDDDNDSSDVFVRDRTTSTTIVASLNVDGLVGDGESILPTLSSDGSRIAFSSTAEDLVESDDNIGSDVFVRLLETGVTVLVSTATGGGPAGEACVIPTIAADGGYVAFETKAATIAGEDGNEFTDVYVIRVE